MDGALGDTRETGTKVHVTDKITLRMWQSSFCHSIFGYGDRAACSMCIGSLVER